MANATWVIKWPTRLGKKLYMAGSDLALRELAEKTERNRWLTELRDIMKRAKLPVWHDRARRFCFLGSPRVGMLTH